MWAPQSRTSYQEIAENVTGSATTTFLVERVLQDFHTRSFHEHPRGTSMSIFKILMPGTCKGGPEQDLHKVSPQGLVQDHARTAQMSSARSFKIFRQGPVYKIMQRPSYKTRQEPDKNLLRPGQDHARTSQQGLRQHIPKILTQGPAQDHAQTSQ